MFVTVDDLVDYLQQYEGDTPVKACLTPEDLADDHSNTLYLDVALYEIQNPEED